VAVPAWPMSSDPRPRYTRLRVRRTSSASHRYASIHQQFPWLPSQSPPNAPSDSLALIVSLRNASSELILARRASEGCATALGDSLACASGLCRKVAIKADSLIIPCPKPPYPIQTAGFPSDHTQIFSTPSRKCHANYKSQGALWLQWLQGCRNAIAGVFGSPRMSIGEFEEVG
jgi:hypothetical protein